MKAPATPSAPPEIRDYVFHDLLGEGSFGWVWRAVWRGSHDRAVKVFKKNRVDIGAVDREMKKLQLVREHSGIVALYDFDLICDTPYYAMSLHAQQQAGQWEGRTLEQLCGKVSPEETVRLLRQVADALAYLHTHRVIHCDVKPSNVLLTDESPPHVKLCDFGQSRGSASVQLEISGTPFYAPPEQLRHPGESGPDEKGRVRGYRWDVYSFGVLAFKLATGKLPRLEELAEAYRKAESGGRSLLPASLATLHDHIPAEHLAVITEAVGEKVEWPTDCTLGAEERRIIEQCLHLDPLQRWGDMEEVKAAFANLEHERKLAAERHLTALAQEAADRARDLAEMAREAEKQKEVELEREHRRREEAEQLRAEAERQKTMAVRNGDEARAQRAHAETRQRAARRMAVAASVLALMATVAGGIAWRMKDSADEQRLQVTKERDKQEELLWMASRSDLATAARALDNGNPLDGLAYLGRALEVQPKNDKAFLKSVEQLSGAGRRGLVTRFHKVMAGTIANACFSPDGAFLAAATEEGEICLLNAVSGEERMLPRSDDYIREIAFSPEGDKLWIVGDAPTVRVITLASGAEAKLFADEEPPKPSPLAKTPPESAGPPPGTGGAAYVPQYVPQDPYAGDPLVRRYFYEPSPGAPLIQREFRSEMIGERRDAGGRWLAARFEKNTIHVYDVEKGGILKSLDIAEGWERFTISRSIEHVALGFKDGLIKVLQCSDGRQIAALQCAGPITGLCFSPDSRLIAVTCKDAASAQGQMLHLIDALTGSKTGSAPLPEGLQPYFFNEDGRVLVFSGEASYKEKVAWRLPEFAPISLGYGGRRRGTYRFNAEATWMAECEKESSGTKLLIRDVRGGEEIVEGIVPAGTSDSDYLQLELSPDGRWLCLVEGGAVRIMEIQRGMDRCVAVSNGAEEIERRRESSPSPHAPVAPPAPPVGTPGAAAAPVESPPPSADEPSDIKEHAFSPDDNMLAVRESDGTLRVMEAETGRLLWQARVEEFDRGVIFSPDGKWLLIGAGSNELYLQPLNQKRALFHAVEGVRVPLPTWGNDGRQASFSRNSRWLALPAGDGFLMVEVSTGKVIRTVGPGIWWATAAGASENLWLTGDEQLVLLDVENGAEQARIPFDMEAEPIAFSEDMGYMGILREKKEVGIIALPSGRKVSSFPVESELAGGYFVDQGRLLVLRGEDKVVSAYDTSSGIEKWRLQSATGDDVSWVNDPFYPSPEGRWFARMGSGKAQETSLEIFDSRLGRKLGVLEVGDLDEDHIFSDDGNFLMCVQKSATGGGDDRKLIALPSLKSVLSLEDAYSEYRFSPGGRWLAARGLVDGTFVLHDIGWLKPGAITPEPGWSEVISLNSGSSFDEGGGLQRTGTAEHERNSRAIREMLRSKSKGDLVSWYFADPVSRTMAPWSKVLVRDHADNIFMAAGPPRKAMIEHCCWRAPWHPLEPLSLARLKPKPDEKMDDHAREWSLKRPRHLARMTLKRLRVADEKVYGRAKLAEYGAWSARILHEELHLDAEAHEALDFAMERTAKDKLGPLQELKAALAKP